MLSMQLFFKISELKYAYKFYAYTKVYPLFFLMGTFLKHLRLIPNILKWQHCKIFTKLVPSQTPSLDLQNLIKTSYSDFRGDIVLCVTRKC